VILWNKERESDFIGSEQRGARFERLQRQRSGRAEAEKRQRRGREAAEKRQNNEAE
jgi:hypothetical protein